MLNIRYTDMNDTVYHDLYVRYSLYHLCKQLRWTKDELLLKLYIIFSLRIWISLKDPEFHIDFVV